MNIVKRGTVEALGTFALVFIGVGAIAMNAGLLGVALAHGLAIAIMATALGSVSGGHFNPAVSLAFAVMRTLSITELCIYWGFQLVGAACASLLWTVVSPDLVSKVSGGLPALSSVTPFSGFVLEGVMSFFLMLTIVTVGFRQKNALAGLWIGLTISLDILLGGPLTGAAMNPARWFGPALVSLNFENAWLYVLGPCLGMLIAAPVGLWLLPKSKED